LQFCCANICLSVCSTLLFFPLFTHFNIYWLSSPQPSLLLNYLLLITNLQPLPAT
jgi:hypothetical protein